jgi:hypothetical protein
MLAKGFAGVPTDELIGGDAGTDGVRESLTPGFDFLSIPRLMKTVSTSELS